MLVPIIEEGMAEQVKMLGQQMSTQINKSIQDVGKKTDTVTNLRYKNSCGFTTNSRRSLFFINMARLYGHELNRNC